MSQRLGITTLITLAAIFAAGHALAQGGTWAASVDAHKSDRLSDKRIAYGVGWGFPTKAAALEAVIGVCIKRGGLPRYCRVDAKAAQMPCVVLLSAGSPSRPAYVHGFGRTRAEAEQDARYHPSRNDCVTCPIEVAECVAE